MRYVNAQDIIPQKLLAELQQYVQGDLLYIPKPEKTGSSGEFILVSVNGYLYVMHRYEIHSEVDHL